MNYRKKPVVIQAVEFHGDRNWHEAPQWLRDATQKGPDEPGALHVFPPNARIMTLEGPIMASPGDFIIRGVKGELYPCKPDIFAASYDTADVADDGVRQGAVSDILAEREKQNAKWGEQNHDPITWSAILIEECGEFAEAALHNKFGGHAAAGLREEAVQCSAVALQIVECLDRNAAAKAA